jgi:hypothetical protein
MAEMRERRLVMDGSVCEDAYSYQDAGVRTAADARARGKQRCPYFQECMGSRALDTRNIRCAARFGQEVAKFVLTDDTSVDAEMADFRKQAWQERHNGFIDPYEDPDVIIIDRDEAALSVEGWAKTILYGPAGDSGATAPSPEPALPSFTELVASATTEEGIDTAKIEAAGRRSTKTNGGVRCDVSSGPCSCGAWH